MCGNSRCEFLEKRVSAKFCDEIVGIFVRRCADEVTRTETVSSIMYTIGIYRLRVLLLLLLLLFRQISITVTLPNNDIMILFMNFKHNSIESASASITKYLQSSLRDSTEFLFPPIVLTIKPPTTTHCSGKNARE